MTRLKSTSLPSRTRLLSLALSVATLAAACGGANEGSSSPGTSAPPPAATPAPGPAPGASSFPQGQPAQWRDITPGNAPAGGDWISIAIDPQDSNVLYAGQCVRGTGVSGVWRSTDRGETWNRQGAATRTDPVDTPEGKVTSYLGNPLFLQVDPNDSTHLYAAGAGWCGNGFGFWESRDSGRTWLMPKEFIEHVGAVAKSFDVGRISVDPDDFGHVLISIRYRPDDALPFGFFEARRIGNGPFTFTTHAAPGPMAKSTAGIDFLSCRTCRNPAGGTGIGNGNTWLVTSEDLGYWRTADGGRTWTNTAPGVQGVHGGFNSHHYTASGMLYMGSFGNPLRSPDNGLTWERIPTVYAGIHTFAGVGPHIFTTAHGSLMTALETDGLNWAPTGMTFQGDPSLVLDPRTNTLFTWGNPRVWMLEVK